MFNRLIRKHVLQSKSLWRHGGFFTVSFRETPYNRTPAKKVLTMKTIKEILKAIGLLMIIGIYECSRFVGRMKQKLTANQVDPLEKQIDPRERTRSGIGRDRGGER